ncbi:MAG TPA: outer membrane beta-barrel protein [Longimicrobiales bacterium]|nr:outer membrane beta-barrel protein [Longimicrobiales bacterium]
MSVQKWVVGMLLAGSILTQEVSAQDKAVGFMVRGGIFNAVTDLDDAGTADFKKTGYNAGVGVNLELSRHFAVRADADLARNELQIDDVETGDELSRLFYDASLQFQYPINNFKPYLFVGAGGVRLHPVGTDDEDETRFAGTGGLGVNYTIPGTQLAFGIEGKSWLYKLPETDDADLKRTQFEASWNATIAYRIPLGAQVVRASR